MVVGWDEEASQVEVVGSVEPVVCIVVPVEVIVASLDLEVVFEEAKRLVEFCNSVGKGAKCLLNLQFLKHSLWKRRVTNSWRRHRLRNVFRLR